MISAAAAPDREEMEEKNRAKKLAHFYIGTHARNVITIYTYADGL